MTGERHQAAAALPAPGGAGDAGDFEDLLACVAFGDRAAFARVYDQLAGAVYGLARTMAGDSEWAQVLAEQALMQVWRAAPQFDPVRASARSWVMSTARRHIASRVRAARAGRTGPDPAMLPAREPGEPARDMPGAAGAAGGPEHQAVLLALCGYTSDEISGRLGLTPAAAAALIRAGLRGAAARELAGDRAACCRPGARAGVLDLGERVAASGSWSCGSRRPAACLTTPLLRYQARLLPGQARALPAGRKGT